MGRAPCCDKAKVKRGPWSPEEDATLKRYLEAHGTGGNWIALPHKAGLKRCGKSCRLRWLNYLRPDIKHGGFTEEEDKIIFTLYGQMGSRWSLIASHLPGRTDNDVKNYWNTKLKKKLLVGNTSQENKNNKSNINIASANYIDNPSSSATTDPCSSSSSLPGVPKSENNYCSSSSLSFWDSLTQSSVTLPMLSDHSGYDPIANATQSLNLDDPIQFSLHGIFDMSELGANLINSHIVSPSQEGSSISDSSSIPVENYKHKTVSLPKTNVAEDAAATGFLMDSRFRFSYDPVNYDGPLFEDQTSQEVASSTYCQSLSGFGYVTAAIADTKQQGHDQSVTNPY